MIVIPVQSKHGDVLIVIVGPTNIARMVAADPLEINCKKLPVGVINPIILFCYEEETPELLALLNRNDLKEIVAHLQRNRKYRPTDNDAAAKVTREVQSGDLEL